MPVVVDTLVRTPDGEFRRFADLAAYEGDPRRVEGAVVLQVDGADVLTRNEWDELDPLWAHLVQAVEACRATGVGETYFPDQPIVLRLETLATGRVLVAANLGETRRAAAAQAGELFRAVGAAGLAFFRHRDRLIRGGGSHQGEADVCSRWLAED